VEILGLAINIAIVVYLVIDAPKHSKNPILWGVLGFIFSGIALGIYLILTDRKVWGWVITIISCLGIIAFLVIIGLFSLFLFSL
jgi:TM2 domain-containing membrane protein YozV